MDKLSQIIVEEYLKLLKENDLDNFNILRNTGFWGSAGAGAIIFSNLTKKFLLPLRSDYVEQPNTWGTWGGAIDNNDSPEQTVRKEISEESGYNGNLKLIPLYVFKSGSFKYYNYLAIVDDEFIPNLNWETKDYGWFNLDEFPNNLHFGLEGILNDKKSIDIMKSYLTDVNDIINEELIRLNEIVSDITYHFTTINQLMNILKTNVINTSPVFGISADANINSGKFYAFSMTSSRHSDVGYGASRGKGGLVRLTMDGRAINSGYGVKRVDYWNRPKDPSDSRYDQYRATGNLVALRKQITRDDELEDRVVTDRNEIKPANKYIKCIEIMINDRNDRHDDYEGIKFLANNLNIPIYFYNEIKYFDGSIKNKSINIESKEPNIENNDYNPSYYAVELLSFVLFNNLENFDKILNGLKDISDVDYNYFLERYEKQLTNLKYYLRYNDNFQIREKEQVLSSYIGNARSSTSPFLRYSIKMFVNDMKKNGVKTLKDYIISKIWKGKKTQKQFNVEFDNKLINVINTSYNEAIKYLNEYSFESTEGDYYDGNITKYVPEIKKDLDRKLYEIKKYCSDYILNNNDMFRYSYVLSTGELKNNIKLDDLKLPDYIDQENGRIDNSDIVRVIQSVFWSIDDFYYNEVKKMQEEYQLQWNN